jgi:hypothetical protein
MATTLTCPNCGAPVRWKGEAPVVACRYCDTHVATGTGRKTKEPAVVRSQMRPRNVAVATGASVLIPILITAIGGLVAFFGSQSGPGGMLGPKFADVAAQSVAQSEQALAGAVGVESSGSGHLAIYFTGSSFDYAVFSWDDEYPDHAYSFGLYSMESNDQIGTVVQWLEYYLGHRFGLSEYGDGWTWRWADAYINVAADGTSVTYHSTPGDDPDWQARSQLMWTVFLASATGQDLKLDPAVKQRWLGTGYTLAEIAKLDVTVTVDQALAEVRSKFPGSTVDESYSLSFEIPVDHPWFRVLEIEWENEAGGQVDDCDLWPPARTNQFPDQRAIKTCLEKTYGKAEVSEVDHLKKKYNYSWHPKSMDSMTVHDHMLSVYLVESSWQRENKPSQKAWTKLMRALDGCGG